MAGKEGQQVENLPFAEGIEQPLGHRGSFGFADLVDLALGDFDDHGGLQGLGCKAQLFGAKVSFYDDAPHDLAAVGGGICTLRKFSATTLDGARIESSRSR